MCVCGQVCKCEVCKCASVSRPFYLPNLHTGSDLEESHPDDKTQSGSPSLVKRRKITQLTNDQYEKGEENVEGNATIESEWHDEVTAIGGCDYFAEQVEKQILILNTIMLMVCLSYSLSYYAKWVK